MAKGKVSIFGDSILKGILLDDNTGRYIVKDELGFDTIANSAGLTMENFSKFGCTITKAWSYVQKMFARLNADIVFMDFGGNDCDFNWRAISESPLDVHRPNTDLHDFTRTYNTIVDFIKARRSLPVLSTLVPVQGQMYLDHLCKTQNLDKKLIMKWLGDEKRIENYQQVYSDAIKGVCAGREIPMIDVRNAFNAHGNVKSLMCSDGIHPNEKGQRVIHDCFKSFINDYIAL